MDSTRSPADLERDALPFYRQPALLLGPELRALGQMPIYGVSMGVSTAERRVHHMDTRLSPIISIG